MMFAGCDLLPQLSNCREEGELSRDRPGALSDAQYCDALIVADISAQAVLVVQADASPGTLAAALETNSNSNYVVHQASGMVAAQLGSTVGQALIRLRAHALETVNR